MVLFGRIEKRLCQENVFAVWLFGLPNPYLNHRYRLASVTTSVHKEHISFLIYYDVAGCAPTALAPWHVHETGYSSWSAVIRWTDAPPAFLGATFLSGQWCSTGDMRKQWNIQGPCVTFAVSDWIWISSTSVWASSNVRITLANVLLRRPTHWPPNSQHTHVDPWQRRAAGKAPHCCTTRVHASVS